MDDRQRLEAHALARRRLLGMLRTAPPGGTGRTGAPSGGSCWAWSWGWSSAR